MQKSHPIKKIKNNLSTLDLTFLMDSLVGLFLAVFLVIALLLLLVKRQLERLTSPSQLSRTFWIITLMVMSFISILSLQSIGNYSKPVILTQEELDILKLLL